MKKNHDKNMIVGFLLGVVTVLVWMYFHFTSPHWIVSPYVKGFHEYDILGIQVKTFQVLPGGLYGPVQPEK